MNKVILFLAAVGVAAALPACSGPDSTSFKLGKGASKLKCADFLASKKKCNKKGKDRGAKIKASLACPQACGACCGDSEEFFYGAKKKGKTCAALAAKEPGPREKVCKKKKGKKIDVKAKEACPAACGRCVPDDAAPTPRPAPRPTAPAPAEECEKAKKGFCAKASTQKCAKKKYADKCPRCGSCFLCRDDKKWRAKTDGLSCKRLAKKAGKRKDPAAYLKKLCKSRKGVDGAKMKVACPATCDALAETCDAPDETPTAAPTAAAANTTNTTAPAGAEAKVSTSLFMTGLSASDVNEDADVRAALKATIISLGGYDDVSNIVAESTSTRRRLQDTALTLKSTSSPSSTRTTSRPLGGPGGRWATGEDRRGRGERRVPPRA
ncbi:hypothetical protein SO694_00018353 [Aureococcus anophagefferens]|uniref:Uncharacterized protein n=1 Tax=Aureococcus anophagefferens TaxID=44056 RepID=A0ABR1G0I3_AURAN